MSIQEAIDKLFTQPLEKYVSLYEDKIQESLSRDSSHIEIDVRDIDIEDISNGFKKFILLSKEEIEHFSNNSTALLDRVYNKKRIISCINFLFWGF